MFSKAFFSWRNIIHILTNSWIDIERMRAVDFLVWTMGQGPTHLVLYDVWISRRFEKKNVKLKKKTLLNTKIIQFQDLVFKETFFKNNFTCLGAYLYHFSNTYFSGRWVCQKLPGQTTTYFTVKSKLCTAKQTLKLFCNSSSFWRN